jgi:hypothetical protein
MLQTTFVGCWPFFLRFATQDYTFGSLFGIQANGKKYAPQKKPKITNLERRTNPTWMHNELLPQINHSISCLGIFIFWRLDLGEFGREGVERLQSHGFA